MQNKKVVSPAKEVPPYLRPAKEVPPYLRPAKEVPPYLRPAKEVPLYLRPAREVFVFPKFDKASDALKQALKIISTPGRWVQGREGVALPLGAEGFDPRKRVNAFDFDDCGPKSKRVHAFCALGVVNFVNGKAQRKAHTFLRNAANELEEDFVTYVNDDLGLDATKRMFRFAIKAALKAESTSNPTRPSKPRKRTTEPDASGASDPEYDPSSDFNYPQT